MKDNIHALVVDDHPLFARATQQILEQVDCIREVGVVGSGTSCLEYIDKHPPDLVFLDYHLPDQPGSEVAEQIKLRCPDIHIIIFSGVDLSDMFNNLVEIGVSGIISKESSESTIKHMIYSVIDNHTMLPLSLFHQARLYTGSSPSDVVLTLDEVNIMNMIVNGFTHEQVAERIHVSKRSVDNYLKKIYDKFSVKTKVQAIEKFVQSKYYADSAREE